MNVAEARLCLLFQSNPEFGDSALAQCLSQAGSPRALAEGGQSLWRELGMGASCARLLARALRAGSHAVDTQLDKLARVDADVLPITDARYPPLLRTIHDPPPVLYVRGDAAHLSKPQLAVVGSRSASPAGLRAASMLGGEACRAGLCITSGLARGIDGAAHQGALLAQGESIAVMATGVDQVYPLRHQKLAAELVQHGCLVSEFPPGTAPLRHNFPRRNRVISGLSLGTLVVEAALPSGSLITARTAMEQGREVFALPWSIYHAAGAGCLYLLRDGAKMVQTVADIVEELGPLFTLQQELLPCSDNNPGAKVRLSNRQERVFGLVGYEPVTADELSALCNLPVAQIMVDLSQLELLGVVTRFAGAYIRS